MQKIPSYRRWSAVLLAFFFVTAWSLKTMHGFLAHADHHDRPVCSAEYDHTTQHIHDTRYATDGCTLCAFVLSVSTLPTVIVLVEPLATPPATEKPVGYRVPMRGRASLAPTSRGPPTA